MIPLPVIGDEDTAAFWDAARDNKLVVQHCDNCGKMEFPPHPYCSACGNPTLGWMPVSGEGSIWSFVIVHRPVLPAFSAWTPFPVVVVELKEAPLRMVGNVVACPGAPIDSVDPSALAVGAPVLVTFEAVGDVVLPRWVLMA